MIFENKLDYNLLLSRIEIINFNIKNNIIYFPLGRITTIENL